MMVGKNKSIEIEMINAIMIKINIDFQFLKNTSFLSKSFFRFWPRLIPAKLAKVIGTK